MRFILFKSSLPDAGGSPEDELFPPSGRIHATSLAEHLVPLGAKTYGVDLHETYGWGFVIRINRLSFDFVLQCYDNEWLVPYGCTSLSKLLRRRAEVDAIEKIENACRSWQISGGSISNLHCYSQAEFDKYSRTFRQI